MTNFYEFLKELKLLLKKYNVKLYCGDYGIVAKIHDGKNERRENIEKDINEN